MTGRSRVTTRARAIAGGLASLALVAAGAAVTVVGAAPVAAAPTSCVRPAAPAGILGMVPPRSASGCTLSAVPSGATPHVAAATAAGSSYNGGTPPLLDGGGSLMGTVSVTGANTVHPVFWSPPGYAYPAGYASTVTTFLADVAADSGKASNVYAVDTQYTQGSAAGAPHLRYAVHAGAAVTVTAAYPAAGRCIPDTSHGEAYTACVTDPQMHTQLNTVIAGQGFPTGMGDLYLLLFPPNVETCTTTVDAASGGMCSDTYYPGFCGYHSWSLASAGIALYADIPYPTAFSYSCVLSQAPDGSPASDGALSLISHEHNEAITDPMGNGWIDSTGNENGDLCAWTFGTPLGGASGAQWNQLINGHHYQLQQEFSNENYALNHAAGCVQTQAVPVASLAVTTLLPSAGAPTVFNGGGSSVPNLPGGISSWSWTFGDATPAVSGVGPSHTYASAGTYTVSLTVTDTDGFSASTSRSLVVVPQLLPSAPTFTSAIPPLAGTVGTAYSYSFAAAGFPAPTFSLVGAPAWLTISASTGGVTGTPPSGTASFSYAVTASNGVGSPSTVGPFAVAVAVASLPQVVPHGYWLVGGDGGIFTFGAAAFHGSTGNLVLQRPVVGITPTADRGGYWLVASDGGIFAFGDSGFFGSLPGLGYAPAGSRSPGPSLAAPIVAMVPSADGGGYFMVASDGGVFAFGDARYTGSCPGIGGCAGAAVAVVPDATGNGYWLVTSTGSVYAFGDAAYLGAPAPLTSPVTAAIRTPDGGGYWILFADGKVSSFGDAVHYGDPLGTLHGDIATAIVSTADGGGYWVATATGVVDNYGDAPAAGGMSGAHLNAPIVAASGW